MYALRSRPRFTVVGLLLCLLLLFSAHSSRAQDPIPPEGAGDPDGIQAPEADPAPIPPSGFTDTRLTNLLQVAHPTDMEFLPDGRLLITGQPGQLYLWSGGTTVTHALDLSGIICSNSERGLVGVTVDPQFTTNHHIYLFYTRKVDPTCPVVTATTPPGSLPGLPVNRVSRFTMTANTVDVASEKVLVDGVEAVWGNHNSGSLHVAADGYLYVTMGEMGLQTQSDNPDSLRGKVLRVNRTTGDGVPGNMYVNDPNAIRCGDPANPRNATGSPCREVFAQGLRNAFKLSFQRGTNNFYITDVGKQHWEEIDLGVAGADYGWPDREGPCPYNTFCVPGALTPPNDPIFWYHHTQNADSDFNNCYAAIGGPFVPPGVWPAEYDGDFLFGDYVCGKIWRLERQSNGTYRPVLFATGLSGTGTSSIVAMDFGPSGSTQALYYLARNGGGQLRKIEYTGSANRPPVAALTATPTAGRPPLTVTLNGSGSSDPDGDTLTYLWTFGDGTPAQEGSASTMGHTYSTAGTFTATLRVRDSRGALSSQTATARIDVGNSAPQATILLPTATQTFAVGETITLQGRATDAEDGILPTSALRWEVILHHDTHVHPYMLPTVGNNLTFVAPAPEDLVAATNSYLEIQLTATDANGLSHTISQSLQPRKVALTLASQPSGRTILVDDVRVVSPATITAWQGDVLTLYAPPQPDSLHRWLVWQAWSDGGTDRHNVTVPTSPTSYTATFRDTGQHAFLPVADSFVQESAPTLNYGADSTLHVEAGTNPDVESYLQFQVSGMQYPVIEASLRIYTPAGGSNAPGLYTTTGNWTENSLTWDTRPARSNPALANLAAAGVGTWLTYPVTAVVQGNGTYNFALVGDGAEAWDFSSREGHFPPQLVLRQDSSAPPLPTPTTEPVQTVRLRVSQSADDAEQQLNDGIMLLASSDLDLVDDAVWNGPQMVGLRFPNVSIPRGATITRAYLEFTADEVDSTPTSLTFHTQAIDHAPPFSASNSNLSARGKSAAAVRWNNVPTWTNVGAAYQTPDLAPIVQEIVGRTGWASGNALAFLVTGTGKRTAEVFDRVPAAAPLLHIEYRIAGGPAPSPTPTATPQPAGTYTARIPTAQWMDDAEEAGSTGQISRRDNDLDLGSDPWWLGTQTVALRFQSLPVPPGSTITRAYLEFVPDFPRSGPTSLVVRAEASDSAPGVAWVDFDISRRGRTTSSIAWNNVPPWTLGTRQQSPSLTTVVQEVIARSGWQEGNAILFLITGSGQRTATAYDTDPARAPILHLEYRAPRAPQPVQPNSDALPIDEPLFLPLISR